MKKIILYLATAITLAGCSIEYRLPDGQTTVYTPTVEVSHYDHDACWEDPYWHSEEWCDYYDDGAMCCVWYVDGWYEEWCQWDYDWCWDYNGSW